MTIDPPNRRWYQFSLKTLLIVVTLFTVGVGCAGLIRPRMQQARTNRARVAAEKLLAETHPRVWYRYKDLRSQTWLERLFDDPGDPDDPVVARQIIGIDFRGFVREVTNEDLKDLNGLTNLQTLHIDSEQVTDAGLEHLEGLTNLRTVNLKGTNVTDEGVKKLQFALPNCKLER